MKIENLIRLLGILLGVGILSSYITLNNGVLLISQGFISPVLTGMAEVFRWSLGLLAAVLMLRVINSAKWLLLLAFLCGLVASWIPFLPFTGYLMRLVDQPSVIQNFIVLQTPNLILVLVVFFLFRELEKSNN